MLVSSQGILMSKKTGYVLWWDESSGEGMIYNPWEQQTRYVHWSAIRSAQKEIVRTHKNLKSGQPVEFTAYHNLYMKQVDTIWPLQFNYTIENEHKLNSLLNQLWETCDIFAFDLADQFYSEAA